MLERSKFSEKGYFVKENAPIYLTVDIEKTAKWFEDILGWYSNIVERDEKGNHILLQYCKDEKERERLRQI